MTEGAKAVLRRRYQVTPAEVFTACTRPDLLARWLGPNEYDAFDVEVDLRVGGRFAFRMRGADGVLGAQGIYQEIVPDQRIVLTWQWIEGSASNPPDRVVSLVTIELLEDGDGTRLTLIHAGLPDQKQVSDHALGWREALDKLDTLFRDDGR